jgi:hypothetical protein
MTSTFDPGGGHEDPAPDFSVGIVAAARGQTNAQQAAQQALATFPKLVTPANLQALGFQSTNELLALQIADPLPMFRLRMDQLSGYRTNQDPNGLLLDTRSVLFPVTVTQQVRSSVLVRKHPDRWKAVSFGGRNWFVLAQARRPWRTPRMSRCRSSS